MNYVKIKESLFDSKLNDYKSNGNTSLKRFKCKILTEDIRNKFKNEIVYLKHVDTKVDKGFIYFDNDKVVSFFSVRPIPYENDTEKNIWIENIYISPEYRGYHLTKQILDICTKRFNANALGVNKKNEIAIKAYQNYGFEIFQENDKNYLMKLNSAANEGFMDIFKGYKIFNEEEIKNKNFIVVMGGDIDTKFVNNVFKNYSKFHEIDFDRIVINYNQEYELDIKNYFRKNMGMEYDNISKKLFENRIRDWKEIYSFVLKCFQLFCKYCNLKKNKSIFYIVYSNHLMKKIRNLYVNKIPLVVFKPKLIDYLDRFKEDMIAYKTKTDMFTDYNIKDTVIPRKINYKKLKTMNLYHLSKNPNLKTIEPRIPSTAAFEENKATKRISFATSIDGCLKAVPFTPTNKTKLYVYTPIIEKSTVGLLPTRIQVFDVNKTNEVWIMSPIKLRLIATIEIVDAVNFKYNVISGDLNYIAKEGYFSDIDIQRQEFDDNPVQTGFINEKSNRWNSLVKIDNKNYRERCEVLIFKENKVFLAKKNKDDYKVPGGSTEPDKTISSQAIREVQEEAGINIKNIKYFMTYRSEYKFVPDWVKKFPKDKQWIGHFNHLFIADYDGKYTGEVESVDKDPFIYNNGKFYNIDDVKDKLKPEFKFVLDSINNEIKIDNHFYFYHFAPKNINTNTGILSPKYMYEHNMSDLFKKSTDKYRDRLVNGWGYYKDKNPEDLTDKEIFDGINKFRESDSGLSYIYFFRYPPYENLGPKMKVFLKTHDCYRIDLNNPEVKKYIDEIYWGTDMSHSDGKKLDENYYRNISSNDYFKRYNDSSKINFAALNHIAIRFKNDYCPINLLEKINDDIYINALRYFNESHSEIPDNYESVLESFKIPSGITMSYLTEEELKSINQVKKSLSEKDRKFLAGSDDLEDFDNEDPNNYAQIYKKIHYIDNKPAGYILAEQHKAYLGAKYFSVALAVNPKYRHKGIAYSLMQDMIKTLKSLNKGIILTYLILKENEASRKLALKAGFKMLENRLTAKAKTDILVLDINHQDRSASDIMMEVEPAWVTESLGDNNLSNIYFLSPLCYNDELLIPRIPNNYLTKNNYEENKTPRVCFSKSIEGCLRGLSRNLFGEELYVHIPESPINIKKIYIPTVLEVPDCNLTDEVWYTDKINITCIGKIKVGKSIDNNLVYTYDGKESKLYDWEYKWMFKYDNNGIAVKEALGDMGDSNYIINNFSSMFNISNLNRVTKNLLSIHDNIKSFDIGSLFTKLNVKDHRIEIDGINFRRLLLRMEETYGSKKILNILGKEYNKYDEYLFSKKRTTRSKMRITKFVVHEFFALELFNIFAELEDLYNDSNYRKICGLLLKKTWIGNIGKAQIDKLDISKLNNLNYALQPYQKEFVQNYPLLKNILGLHGHILAFEQGLGKTLTSISLAECMEKEKVYILCPNKLTGNWADEIKAYYKKYNDDKLFYDEVCVLNNNKFKITDKTRFIITNYENIKGMLEYVEECNNMIIVDESHNFRNLNGSRVKELISLKDKLKCKDVLLCSGTPIKAVPSEIVPSLMMIDPIFDMEAAEIFVKCFNINSTAATDIVKTRFGYVMYRKDKSELTLPEKFIINMKVKIKNADKYSLKMVKDDISARYREIFEKKCEDIKEKKERYVYFLKKYCNAPISIYRSYYKNKVEPVETGEFPEIHEYDKEVLEGFEKKYLIPNIPKDEMKEFKKARTEYMFIVESAVGTALGEILPKRRTEMYISMYEENKEKFINVIENNDKKVVIFSQFKQVVDYICDDLNKYGIGAVKITGNIKNTHDTIKRFKEDGAIDVIVATTQSMGTGHTLIEANKMFFFGAPWRSTDFDQCCDRIHRIGQTTPVYIHNVILDTEFKNLSSRMKDILNWSDNMFSGYITDNLKEDIEKISTESTNMDTNIVDRFEILENKFNSITTETFNNNSGEDLFLNAIRNIFNNIPIQEEYALEVAKYSDTSKYPVFVVLMHSGTILANIIKKVTNDQFSHACISFNSKLNPLYSFGRKKDRF